MLDNYNFLLRYLNRLSSWKFSSFTAQKLIKVEERNLDFLLFAVGSGTGMAPTIMV